MINMTISKTSTLMGALTTKIFETIEIQEEMARIYVERTPQISRTTA